MCQVLEMNAAVHAEVTHPEPGEPGRGQAPEHQRAPSAPRAEVRGCRGPGSAPGGLVLGVSAPAPARPAQGRERGRAWHVSSRVAHCALRTLAQRAGGLPGSSPVRLLLARNRPRPAGAFEAGAWTSGLGLRGLDWLGTNNQGRTPLPDRKSNAQRGNDAMRFICRCWTDGTMLVCTTRERALRTEFGLEDGRIR